MSNDEIAQKLDVITALLTGPAVTPRLTCDEAAVYCKVSVETIRLHARGGYITFSQPSGKKGGIMYFEREHLEEYMSKGKIEAIIISNKKAHKVKGKI
jgi:hypothetical protein